MEEELKDEAVEEAIVGEGFPEGTEVEIEGEVAEEKEE